MSLTIGVPREVFPEEKRVATVPEVVEKLITSPFAVAARSRTSDRRGPLKASTNSDVSR